MSGCAARPGVRVQTYALASAQPAAKSPFGSVVHDQTVEGWVMDWRHSPEELSQSRSCHSDDGVGTCRGERRSVTLHRTGVGTRYRMQRAGCMEENAQGWGHRAVFAASHPLSRAEDVDAVHEGVARLRATGSHPRQLGRGSWSEDPRQLGRGSTSAWQRRRVVLVSRHLDDAQALAAKLPQPSCAVV